MTDASTLTIPLVLRPIAEAPQDGRILLLFHPQHPELVAGWYQLDRKYPWAFLESDHDWDMIRLHRANEEDIGGHHNAFAAEDGPTHFAELPRASRRLGTKP